MRSQLDAKQWGLRRELDRLDEASQQQQTVDGHAELLPPPKEQKREADELQPLAIRALRALQPPQLKSAAACWDINALNIYQRWFLLGSLALCCFSQQPEAQKPVDNDTFGK